MAISNAVKKFTQEISKKGLLNIPTDANKPDRFWIIF